MTEKAGSPAPRARRDGVVEEGLGDELLVYDLERHQAHALTPVAASLWRLLDGTRDTSVLEAALAAAFPTQRPDLLVELALEELGALGLLEGRDPAWEEIAMTTGGGEASAGVPQLDPRLVAAIAALPDDRLGDTSALEGASNADLVAFLEERGAMPRPPDASAPSSPDSDPLLRFTGTTDRRDALRRLARTAGLAVALPLVHSVWAPLAAQAATCVPLASCTNLPASQCGTTLPICEARTFCCVRTGNKCKIKGC